MRISRKSFPRQLKRRNRLRTSYGGKLIEKDFEAVASLKVVEQNLDGNAGTYKYRRSAQDLRIAVHDEIVINHCRILISISGYCSSYTAKTFKHFISGDRLSSIGLRDRFQELRLKFRWNFKGFIRVTSKDRNDGALWQGIPFHDDLSAYDRSGG